MSVSSFRSWRVHYFFVILHDPHSVILVYCVCLPLISNPGQGFILPLLSHYWPNTKPHDVNLLWRLSVWVQCMQTDGFIINIENVQPASVYTPVYSVGVFRVYLAVQRVWSRICSFSKKSWMLYSTRGLWDSRIRWNPGCSRHSGNERAVDMGVTQVEYS